MKLPLRPPAAAVAFTVGLALLSPVAALLQQPGQTVLSADSTGQDGVTGEKRKASNNPLDDKFGEFVQAALDRWHVPGMAVSVVDGDDTWAEVRSLIRFFPFSFLEGGGLMGIRGE